MPQITDPSVGLKSFQLALKRGEINVTPARTDPRLFIHYDQPQGEMRLTHARLERKTVTAIAMLTEAEPVERVPCFGIGYAVPRKYRGQGRAKNIVSATLVDFRAGMLRNGITHYFVEAIVGADNVSSQRVAAHCLGPATKETTDAISGMAAFQYLLEVRG